MFLAPEAIDILLFISYLQGDKVEKERIEELIEWLLEIDRAREEREQIGESLERIKN